MDRDLFFFSCSSVLRYTEFGEPNPHRPVEDLAFAVARFIQSGGSFFNYYMVGFFFALFYFFLTHVLVVIRALECLLTKVHDISTTGEPTLDAAPVVHLSQPATTTTPQSMNMVRHIFLCSKPNLRSWQLTFDFYDAQVWSGNQNMDTSESFTGP